MSQVFGLGIVLNFVDNATSGMNVAVQTFNQMSEAASNASSTVNEAVQQLATGQMLTSAGNSLIRLGSSMTGVISNMLNNVRTVGSDFESFKITLGQIYGSAEAADTQISKLMDFSVKSPFEVADVKDLLVTLKSQGIEAFDSITGSITGTNQETLQWMSDLMAFKPEVPMERWKLAFQNFLGSGEFKVLRNILDMGNLEQIIGHDASDTVEGRMNDLVEIVEKKNLTGLTESMFGTMQQNISNIEDFFTMFYKAIGDAGVFEQLSEITGVASQLFATFDNESGKLPALASIVADAFNTLLKPVTALTHGLANLVESFLNFAIANPVIGKLAIALFGLAGAGTVALGWILRMSGSILQLVASIKLLGGVRTILSTVGIGISKFGSMALMSVAVGTLFYQAWKNNFLGIQDAASNLTQKLDVLWTYFTSGELSAEQWNIVEQFGMQDLLHNLDQIKYYADYFKQGFSEGWNDFFTTMFNGIERAVNAIQEFVNIDLHKFTDPIREFLENALGIGLEGTYTNIGKVVGTFAALTVTLYPLYRIIKKISGIGGILGVFGGKGGKSSGGGSSGGFSPKSMLKTMGNVAIVIGGITAIVTAMGALTRIPGFTELVGGGIGTIISLAQAILPLVASGGAFALLCKEFSVLNVNPKTALKGIASLGIIIAGLSGIVTVMSLIMSIPMGKFSSEQLLEMAVVVGALGIIGSALAALGGLIGLIPVAQVALGLANMAIMIGGLTALMAIISLLPASVIVNTSVMIQLAQTLAVLGIVGTALTVFGGIAGLIPVTSVIMGLVNIGLVLTSLTGLLLLLNSVPEDINLSKIMSIAAGITVLGTLGSVLSVFAGAVGLIPFPVVVSGLANIATVLGGMTTLISAFGALSQIPGFNEFISSGGDTLANLFSQIGKIAGSLVGGIGEGLTSSLPAIGENIAQFASNIKPLFDLAGSVNAEGLGSFLNSVADFMLKLTGNDILSFFTGGTDLGSLGTQLNAFATSITPFFTAVANVPQEGLANAPKVFEALSGINENLPKSGGVAQFFTGETDLVSMAVGLAAFAPSAVVFFNTVATINTQGFENAKLLFESLSDISNVPNAGGVAQFFSGTNDFQTLANELPGFGEAMSQFYASIQGLDSGVFEKAKLLFQSLSDISNIPNTGGFAQLFTGTNDITGTGSALKQFGQDIAPFLAVVNNYDVSKVGTFFSALTQLQSVADIDSSGLASKGTELSEFMTNLETFFTKMGEVNVSSISNFTSTLSSFYSTVSNIVTTNITGLTSSLDGLNSKITSIGQPLGNLGGSISNFSQTVADAAEGINSIKEISGNISLTIKDEASSVIGTVKSNLENLTSPSREINIRATDNASTTIGNVKGAVEGLPKDHTTDLLAEDTSVSSTCSAVTRIINEVPKDHTTELKATDKASRVIENVKDAIDDLPTKKTITIDVKQNGEIPGNAKGTNYFEGGLTWINEQGGELIELPRGTTIIPHDQSIMEAMNRGMQLGARALGGYVTAETNTKSIVPATTSVQQSADIRRLTKTLKNSDEISRNTSSSRGSVSYDYSVTFSEGSIVIQAPQNGTQEDYSKMAEQLMKYIERIQQKKAMARR